MVGGSPNTPQNPGSNPADRLLFFFTFLFNFSLSHKFSTYSVKIIFHSNTFSIHTVRNL